MNEEPQSREAALQGADTPVGIIQQVGELFEIGGPVVVILVGLSVMAITIVLAKLLQFRAARLGERDTAYRALQLWQTGQQGEAVGLAASSPNPVAQALARAMRGQRRGLPETRIREEVMRYGGDVLETLRGWFRPLEVIGSLAPLLGLFGTVLGMIEAFRQLELAGNQVNPAILSGGIWEALLTTAVGLAVAMPVVAVLNWLERRVDRLAHEMDSVVTRVFTDDLANRADDHDSREVRAVHPHASPQPLQLATHKRRRRPLISLTPLIDVVFILLIFFMLASSFLDWRTIDLDPPARAAAGDTLEGALLVEVRPQELRLGGRVVSLESLARQVEQRIADRPDRRVLVQAAPGVPLQRAVNVLDRLAAVGVAQLSLIRGGG